VAQHDYSIANQSGAAFRQDLNNALAAIVSINSGSTAPATTFAYMLWLDTAAGQVKQRNAANNAWVVIGTLGSVGWGLLSSSTASSTYMPLAGGTFSGNVNNTATGYLQIPNGTTAQRPGSPSAGMVRWNSSLNRFEGYGTAWGAIGGGATGGGSDNVFYENDQTVNNDYTLTSGKNAMSAGPITIASGITVTVPVDSNWSIV
jgi:hypothetical protein